MGKSAIVLAAGLGTRMKSKKHKVLHEVCGKPMILYILDELDKLALDQIIVVVGKQREQVEAVVAGRATVVYQAEQKGTGHAVQMAIPVLDPDSETTVVLYGDAPMIQADTIGRLLAMREQQSAAAIVLAANVNSPEGLGRIIQDDDGTLLRIVEEKDASMAEKQVHLINTGIYAFATADMKRSVQQLKADNSQQEYYLTDTIGILQQERRDVRTFTIEDDSEIASVNDRVQLSVVEQLMRKRICEHWMRQGVTIIDPAHTYIGPEVELGQDTVIMPGSILEGSTSVGEDCLIGPNTRIVTAKISSNVRVEHSVVLQSQVGEHTTIGPFAYLRPGTRIGTGVRIGDFVEIKNSEVGNDSKVSHLSYVGDAKVGQRVNIGCGVVTVNYDGREKHVTVIGDDSFVGSNVNLVAPVTVGEGAYLCAGSTITDGVPDDGFAIARNRQVTKEHYVSAWKENQSK